MGLLGGDWAAAVVREISAEFSDGWAAAIVKVPLLFDEPRSFRCEGVELRLKVGEVLLCFCSLCFGCLASGG